MPSTKMNQLMVFEEVIFGYCENCSEAMQMYNVCAEQSFCVITGGTVL